uniref:Mucin-22-like n=1 Tax=Ascaris lumbricoides TaxID=6252 RepID=A0A0M3IF01_ASCLU
MKLLPIVWMIIAVTKSFFMNAPLNLGEQAILPPIRTNATHAVYFYDGIFRYEPLHANAEQAATKTIIEQSIKQLVSTSSPINYITISTSNLTNERKENIDERTTTKSSFNKEDILSEKQFSLESGPTQFSNDEIVRSEEISLLITPPIEQEILKREETTIAVNERINTEISMRESGDNLTTTTPKQPDTTMIKIERTFMQQEESTTQMTTQQPFMSERNFLLFSKGDNNISIVSTRSNEEAAESSTHIDGLINRESTQSFAMNSGIVTRMRTTTSADDKTTATDSITADVLVSANNKMEGTATSTYRMTTATERAPAEATVFAGRTATEIATFTDKPTTEGISTELAVSAHDRSTETLSADYRTTGNERSSTETIGHTGNVVLGTATFADKTATGRATEAAVSVDNKTTETAPADSKTAATMTAMTEATALIGNVMTGTATFADKPTTKGILSEVTMSADSRRAETMSADYRTTGNERLSTETTASTGNVMIRTATLADKPTTKGILSEVTVSADNRGEKTVSADYRTTGIDSVMIGTATFADKIAPNRATEATVFADKKRTEIMSTHKKAVGNGEASTETTVSGDSQGTETVTAGNGMTGNEGAPTQTIVQIGNEIMENATFADKSPTQTGAQATVFADDKTTAADRTSTETTALVGNMATEKAMSIDRPPAERISAEDTISVDNRTTTNEYTSKDAMKPAQNQTRRTEENDATSDLEILNPITSMRNIETTTQPLTIYSHYVVTELNKNNTLTSDVATSGWYDRFYDNKETSKDFENEPQTWAHSNPGLGIGVPPIRATNFHFIATDVDSSREEKKFFFFISVMTTKLMQNDEIRLRRTDIENISTNNRSN